MWDCEYTVKITETKANVKVKLGEESFKMKGMDVQYTIIFKGRKLEIMSHDRKKWIYIYS
jgi:hypothetical protein